MQEEIGGHARRQAVSRMASISISYQDPSGQTEVEDHMETVLECVCHTLSVCVTSLSYGVSPAIWDCTVLPAAQHN